MCSDGSGMHYNFMRRLLFTFLAAAAAAPLFTRLPFWGTWYTQQMLTLQSPWPMAMVVIQRQSETGYHMRRPMIALFAWKERVVRY